MRYLITVFEVHPLRLYFSLQNDGAVPTYVPRLLTPLGAFVSVTIRDVEGVLIYQTQPPKMKLKLDPSRDDSYFDLDAGYSYGVVLELDQAALVPGEYHIEISFSNGPFQGTSRTPVGVLSYHTSVPLHLEK